MRSHAQAGPHKAEQSNELGAGKERSRSGWDLKTSFGKCKTQEKTQLYLDAFFIVFDCLSRLRGQRRIREAVQFLGAEVDMSLTWEAPDMHMKQGDKSDLMYPPLFK